MTKLFIIPYSIPAKKTSLRTASSIPYKIIQTMKTNNVPEKMYLSAMSWSKKNPEYDYEFFDDNRIIKFIKNNYNKNILTKFMVINSGAAKADFFRWLYLYKHGGIYVDIDSVCLKPINEITKQYQNNKNVFISKSLLYNNVQFWPSLKNIGYRINHNLIIASPHHILLKKSINYSLRVFNDAFKRKKNIKLPQNLCGPSILGFTLNLSLNKPKLTLNYPGNYNIHEVNNFRVILLNSRYVRNYINPKYTGYDIDEKITSGPHYNLPGVFAFSYIKCKKYLEQNKIDFFGNNLN